MAKGKLIKNKAIHQNLFLEFNSRARLTRDKRDTYESIMIFMKEENSVLMLLEVEYFH